ncbi:hypothetical protein NCCP2331_10620 [Sporosarcina sp. NCCP-2331]|nr:hypothetical protein NCCP2331_10620 [Sporosarcina sp. NCCP-2331]GLB55019.1 hypothetical protein NCCP2378_08040 [Sporosarcina sp. NCCP-2378]
MAQKSVSLIKLPQVIILVLQALIGSALALLLSRFVIINLPPALIRHSGMIIDVQAI